MVSMGFGLLAGKGLIGNGATIMGFVQVVAATFDQLTKQLQDLFAQMIALQEQPEAITTPVEKIERSRKREHVDIEDSSTLPLQQKSKLIFDRNRIDKSSNCIKANEASPLIAAIQRTNFDAGTLSHKDSGLPHMYPSVDLGDDEDKHFSFETDEGGFNVEQLENDILDSKEKIDFYRTKMQELVLYKSRCDHQLNEIIERVSADKREVPFIEVYLSPL
ncbi:hypothetical protein MRB53_002656 [Persea americana]|uniref:Uncharacterized protein n=1 Tax=Persea americana TaxID=3435 RepID=A0ACC2MW23_PERAE|nr:hypothetical protein MRB53_002656 [Persea americana]